MNIYYCGLCAYDELVSFNLALSKVATNYVQSGRDTTDAEFLKIVSENKPDLIFFQLQGKCNLTSGCVKSVSNFKINWSGDMRWPLPEWYAEWASVVDVTSFSNSQCVEAIQDLGFSSEFIQIGIDPAIYFKRDSKKDTDVVFMCNNHGTFPLSGYRQEVARRLKKDFTGFRLYGSGWNGHEDGNLNSSQCVESEYYNRAKIAISISNFNTHRYTSDRLLRALASGTMVLCHNYEGITEDFAPGVHLDVFNDYDELVSKINFYLRNDGIREKIAQNGHDYCHRTFTFDHMVDNIVKCYTR